MLDRITNIEGLDTFANVDMLDDTPPDATRIWFDVVNVEMPYLSEKEGRLVTQPFVHKFFEMELGRMKGDKRIRDQVELDPETGKWRVKKLADQKQSDILKYRDAWNAFARGQTFEAAGTPLSVLFRSDHGKVDRYRYFHISTVEQLSALPETQIQELGFGARDDVTRAKAFLKRAQDTGAVLSINRELEEERTARKALEDQVKDLTDKLTQLLKEEIEQPRRRGRPSKQEPISVEERI